MIDKLYSKIIQYIKESYKFIILLLLFTFFITLPVPYYIHSTGGIINITDKVTIDKSYNSKGSLNLSYVTEIKGNVITYLFSFVLRDWDLIKKDEVKASNETVEEYGYRNSLFLKQANQNAVIVAYKALNKKITIKDEHIYVVYISEDANTNLKIKDEILEVDGNSISSINEYTNIVNKHSVGDIIDVKVKDKDGNEQNKYIEVHKYKDKKITGIYIIEDKNIEVNPEVSFSFKSSESGPSGGLMMSIAIYDKLTKEDVTKGKKVVGTGTIDENGNVGDIGGVKYKIRGAIKNNADIFILPKGNYKEAKEELDKHNTNMILVSVDTFNDAIEYLKNN